jgi:queuine tRNA-ribosyltransferase
MGVGDPIDVRHAFARGIDMMDCVLPTRNARHGQVWFSDKNSQDLKMHLTNKQFEADPAPIMEGCDCTTCLSGISRGFLRHQFKIGETIAGTYASIHNLRYLQRIAEELR